MFFDHGWVRQRRPLILAIAVASLLTWSERTARAQVVNPASGASNASEQPQTQQSTQLHTWEMPPIDVYGKAPLTEEDRIGDYEQPRWTAHRRFGETRVYVIPKGMMEFEYWLIPKTHKDGPTEFQTQYEVEFGLPGRFQLDLYAVANKTGKEGSLSIDEQKVELRYALADWGRIPGNPTLYFEWEQVSGGPDAVEVKLLLGGHIVSGWHWGSNLVWEHQTGGAEENSNEWTTGISYTVRDTKASVGLETQLALVNELDERGKRGDFSKEFLIGPSIQIRPLPRMHVDFAPLFGVTHAAPRAKVFVVIGWEF